MFLVIFHSMPTITRFQDIKAWQMAHKTVLEIYKVTRNFPKEELYGVTSQMRRAMISVAANIVEGFYRNTTKESLRFYEVAMSSLEEVKYFLLLSYDLKYLPLETYQELSKHCNETGRTLRGWINVQK